MLENKPIIEYKYPQRGLSSYIKVGGQQVISNSAQYNLVQWSNQTLSIGSIAAGAELVYTTSLTPTEQFYPFANMAIPYITIHTGTPISTSNQIYPYSGASIAVGAFNIYGGFDLLRVDNPRNSYYSMTIKNNGTAGYNLYFYNRWQYVQSNSGAQTL